MSTDLLQVAIIGSGPAGYYTAEALAESIHAVSVDVIDRLPTPFGLIRTGVAPDHQSIKNVTKRYDQTASRDDVRFVGNLSIGRDVSVAELLDLYDAVVLATGALQDRKLGISGEDLAGVRGSADIVGWYNTHPDYVALTPELNTPSVVIIGNGNVAIDVARVLAKTEAEMAGSDISPKAKDAISRMPLRTIRIFGRRGPMDASFTPKELGEMGRLERAVPLVDKADLPSMDGDADLEPKQRKVLAALRGFGDHSAQEKPVQVHFGFYARPVEILGHDRVDGVLMERTRVENGACIGTGEMFTVPCGLLISCIGYRSSAIEGVPFDERLGRFVNNDGFISDRLYAVGWARRGPTGTIGTNKPDGAEIAKRILNDVQPMDKPGRKGLDALIAKRQIRAVTFRDWQKIDAAERQAAEGENPRLKFARLDDMLDVVGNEAIETQQVKK
ncbi:FAD-dependent oxidoreductase [Iodidimonas gelatinilytica]|uniref:FAD-dependent oxidoreductase n=1 Tax=Iodidimonas gelatinilytica TaxID=1236966 RepID=UPI001B2FFF3B|nr:FAD-dependent oxidoreductase [Iodidimonas gelatinilytica]